MKAYFVNDFPQVNGHQASRPAGVNWRGPSFTVKATELDFSSTQVNQQTYSLSFVQARIKAASEGGLEIVGREPTSQPFEETELVTTENTKVRAVAAGAVLGPTNPALTVGTSATQTSGVTRKTSEWNVTPHIDEEVAGVLSAVWNYAHKDDAWDPVKMCTSDRKFHPWATFGFQTIKTEVEVGLTLFWSLDRNFRESQGKIKHFFPMRWPWTKSSNPIFFNFVYQISVVVDLEKIPDGDSWIMSKMKPDNVKKEDLDPSKSAVPLGQTADTARQYSESGEMNDVVSTDCSVIIKTAVKGRVELTPEERTGVNP